MRATGAVAILTVVLGVVGLVVDGDVIAQDLIRFSTLVSGSVLAVWVAGLRERYERANTELGEALGLLDVVFAHAPVGLALLDRDLRYVRVNDRLAEINGLPAGEHLGRTISELLPDLAPEVEEDAALVVRTGAPLIEVEVTGSTPAHPGVAHHWVVSYWPVRREADGEPIGVGIVVIDVTERRAAERALRDQTDRYEALLHALSDAGEGLVVLEADGRCMFANTAFEQLSGYAFPELASMDTVLDLVVEYDDMEVRRRVLRQMAEGDVQPGQPLTLRRRDGAWVDLEVGGTPLEIEGHRQLVVVVRDVTARRRAEAERERLLARAALLAEASELFDRSLDEEITLRRVAQLVVRDIAQTCVILLGDRAEQLRGIAAAARDEARERELLSALEGGPLASGALFEVLSGGAARVTATPAGLGTARSVIVPLRARGRAHGALVAGFDDLAEASDADALALFEDLARRAALALDNARLYAERDQVARTLQRSLLPGALPDVPGVELAGRYLAAGEGNEVGGDFYDCFAVREGEWALVIGDVCGKGAEAATLTALARYTIRAAAQHTADPRAVLGELNEALLRQQLGYRFCTVLYASLIPRGSRVSACMATGGHPLPLVLRADGTVDTAGSPGSLLGILEDPDLSQTQVELGPGDALVLVTDGVTEEIGRAHV
jgi:PAS domain S-box-containing protein